jgi:hypothetical protein
MMRPLSPPSTPQIELKTGLKFGDASNPLLVSVRSGAAVSMPGMMDTVLNLGMSQYSRISHHLHSQKRPIPLAISSISQPGQWEEEITF